MSDEMTRFLPALSEALESRKLTSQLKPTVAKILSANFRIGATKLSYPDSVAADCEKTFEFVAKLCDRRYK